MLERTCINQLMRLGHLPFLLFLKRMEEQDDNSFKALRFIQQEEKTTASALAEYLDIRPSSVSQILTKLEETGAIERFKSPEDGRVILISLSEDGKKILDSRKNLSDRLYEEMFAGFSKADLQELVRGLEQLLNNIQGPDFQADLKALFGNDEEWQAFSQISAHFGRARERMLNRDREANFHHWRNFLMEVPPKNGRPFPPFDEYGKKGW